MKYIRHLLLMFVLKGLYKSVTIDDMLIHKGPRMFIGTKELSNEEKQGIISEAEYLRRSAVLRLLFSEMRLMANQQIINKATNIDGMIVGRLQLWAIETLEQLINNVANTR